MDDLSTRVEILEWRDAFLPDVTLSERDRRLVSSLSGVDIREMRNGLYIKASSRVGVIQFETFTLKIRPKLANVDVLRMLLIAGGVERIKRYSALRNYDLYGELTLFDLVALLLIDACKVITRDGLLQGYVVEESDLAVMRGRLLVTKQIRQRYGQINRLECRYDDHHANILENQILCTALNLCRRLTQNRLVQRKVQGLLDIFAAVCDPLTIEWRSAQTSISYNRMNSRYQDAHTLSWVIFQSLGVEELMADWGNTGFAFLLDMNALFEKVIEVFVRSAFRPEEMVIRAQVNVSSSIWDVERNRSYKKLRPDLLLETNKGQQLAVDAKYKRYNVKKLNEGDIYQTFLYAFAFRNESLVPAGLLLYPSESSTFDVTRLHIRDQRGIVYARLHAMGVDIPALLDGFLREKNQEIFRPFRQVINGLLR